MPLVDEVMAEDNLDENGQEIDSLEDMLIVVDQLEQTVAVMGGVINRLKSQIHEVRDSMMLELTAEEFLAEYEDPHALIH